MNRTIIILVLSFVSYISILGAFSRYMASRPIAEKLGYVPSVEVVKAVSADQKELVSAFFVTKVLLYFGGLLEKQQNELPIPPDYPAMSRMIHGAVQLDPYNMDAYYFAQSILVWDVGKVEIANELLDYGMRFRAWDWYLPYFAGFNHAYFLKDYAGAARYYEQAGRLSGSDLLKNLAGRYLQESGKTDMALAYLYAMEKGEKNPAIKKSFRTRMMAFQEVRHIEIARDHYRQTIGRLPATVEVLIQEGYLRTPPVDPYGGHFYLELDGRVATTSKFAFVSTKSVGKKNKVQGAH